MEGTPFIIQTDHYPLITAVAEPVMHGPHDTPPLPLRSQVDPYLLTVRTYPVADALSRIAIYDELAREQHRDHETSDYETYITNLQWEKIQMNNNFKCFVTLVQACLCR